MRFALIILLIALGTGCLGMKWRVVRELDLTSDSVESDSNNIQNLGFGDEEESESSEPPPPSSTSSRSSTVRSGLAKLRGLIERGFADWRAYKQRHGKMYPNEEEDNERMLAYLSAKQFIHKHNQAYRQGKVGFEVGENHIADLSLLYVADSFVFRRIPNLLPELSYTASMPNWPNWCLLIFSFLANGTLLANDIATTFLLFNRLTAIAWPISHRKIWRKILPFAILAIFAFNLVYIDTFSSKVEVAIQRGEIANISYVVPRQNKSSLVTTSLMISVVCSILFLIFCTVISIVTLIYYKRQSGSHQSNVQSPHAQAERKLMVYAFVTFLGQVMDSIAVICLYLAKKNGNSFWQTIVLTPYELMMDLGMVILPSWLLLWANPHFKIKLASDFIPRKLRKKIFKKIVPAEGLQIKKEAIKTLRVIPVANTPL